MRPRCSAAVHRFIRASASLTRTKRRSGSTNARPSGESRKTASSSARCAVGRRLQALRADVEGLRELDASPAGPSPAGGRRSGARRARARRPAGARRAPRSPAPRRRRAARRARAGSPGRPRRSPIERSRSCAPSLRRAACSARSLSLKRSKSARMASKRTRPSLVVCTDAQRRIPPAPRARRPPGRPPRTARGRPAGARRARAGAARSARPPACAGARELAPRPLVGLEEGLVAGQHEPAHAGLQVQREALEPGRDHDRVGRRARPGRRVALIEQRAQQHPEREQRDERDAPRRGEHANPQPPGSSHRATLGLPASAGAGSIGRVVVLPTLARRRRSRPHRAPVRAVAGSARRRRRRRPPALGQRGVGAHDGLDARGAAQPVPIWTSCTPTTARRSPRSPSGSRTCRPA